jgi:adenylate cyclase
LGLRATVSLCRTWQARSKRPEARDMLAETCGWFTEGFDTAELKEAQALLDTLA